MIIVLTGDSGSGKTTLCQRIVASLKGRGSDVAGVLTRPRFALGQKAGMDVQDVRTGERRALAERAAMGEGTAKLGWQFDGAGLAWGAQALRGAMPCDVLVVDELGPLELVHNQGWIVALDILRTNQYRDALVVVRSELLERLRLCLKREMQVLTVTRSNRDELHRRIVRDYDPRIHVNPRKSTNEENPTCSDTDSGSCQR